MEDYLLNNENYFFLQKLFIFLQNDNNIFYKI